MQKLITLVLLAVLLLASTAIAFDGNRKGFVLGGGLGFAPKIKTEAPSNVNPMYDYDESGMAANLFLGYGWDEYNMIVWEANIAIYSQTLVNFSQGIAAATWYHYFGEKGSSFFSAAGVGLAYFDVNSISTFDRKFGFLVGGGYEFATHWQAGVYFSNGKTGVDFVDVEFKHTTISVLVNGVAF